MPQEEQSKQNDHDLLIELHTIIKQVRTDIQDLKSNLADRVTKLEMTKYASSDFIQFRNTEFVPLVNEVRTNKEKINRYALILGIVWFLFTVGVIAGWQYFLARINTPAATTTTINTTSK